MLVDPVHQPTSDSLSAETGSDGVGVQLGIPLAERPRVVGSTLKMDHRIYASFPAAGRISTSLSPGPKAFKACCRFPAYSGCPPFPQSLRLAN